MKKILAFWIVLAILLTSASCSAGKSVEEGPKDAEKTEAVPAEAKQGGASEETDAPETEIPDNLPARDFAGQALRIAAEPDKEYEIRSEELNGEITNDVIYNRNIGIEERFNAKIESVILSAGQKDNIQNILEVDHELLSFSLQCQCLPDFVYAENHARDLLIQAL